MDPDVNKTIDTIVKLIKLRFFPQYCFLPVVLRAGFRRFVSPTGVFLFGRFLISVCGRNILSSQKMISQKLRMLIPVKSPKLPPETNLIAKLRQLYGIIK